MSYLVEFDIKQTRFAKVRIDVPTGLCAGEESLADFPDEAERIKALVTSVLTPEELLAAATSCEAPERPAGRVEIIGMFDLPYGLPDISLDVEAMHHWEV